MQSEEYGHLLRGRRRSRRVRERPDPGARRTGDGLRRAEGRDRRRRPDRDLVRAGAAVSRNAADRGRRGAAAQGFGVNFSERIGGETFAGQTRTIAVFATRPRVYEIPPFVVTTAVADDNARPTGVLRLETPPLRFEARLPDEARGLGLVVATRSMTATQRWDGETDGLRENDALTRTIATTIEDSPAMLLPVPPFEAPDGVAVYADRPEVEDDRNRGRVRVARPAARLSPVGELRDPRAPSRRRRPRTTGRRTRARGSRFGARRAARSRGLAALRPASTAEDPQDTFERRALERPASPEPRLIRTSARPVATCEPLLVACAFGDRFHHAVEVEAAGLLARRELLEALQPLADIGAGGRKHEHVIDPPFP